MTAHKSLVRALTPLPWRGPQRTLCFSVPRWACWPRGNSSTDCPSAIAPKSLEMTQLRVPGLCFLIFTLYLQYFHILFIQYFHIQFHTILSYNTFIQFLQYHNLSVCLNEAKLVWGRCTQTRNMCCYLYAVGTTFSWDTSRCSIWKLPLARSANMHGCWFAVIGTMRIRVMTKVISNLWRLSFCFVVFWTIPNWIPWDLISWRRDRDQGHPRTKIDDLQVLSADLSGKTSCKWSNSSNQYSYYLLLWEI